MSDVADVSYQDQRREAIEDAAYALLAEKGYKASSMLAIARKAKASNETLYRWYGNKQALFASLVEANAREVTSVLTAALDGASDAQPLETLSEIGPLLLTLVTSDRAIALNRAAAADVHDSAKLGEIIAQSGREQALPKVQRLLDRAKQAGQLDFPDGEPVAEIWSNVLIGDLQIASVIGARQAPDAGEISERNRRAMAIIRKLYG